MLFSFISFSFWRISTHTLCKHVFLQHLLNVFSQFRVTNSGRAKEHFNSSCHGEMFTVYFISASGRNCKDHGKQITNSLSHMHARTQAGYVQKACQGSIHQTAIKDLVATKAVSCTCGVAEKLYFNTQKRCQYIL